MIKPINLGSKTTSLVSMYMSKVASDDETNKHGLTGKDLVESIFDHIYSVGYQNKPYDDINQDDMEKIRSMVEKSYAETGQKWDSGGSRGPGYIDDDVGDYVDGLFLKKMREKRKEKIRSMVEKSYAETGQKETSKQEQKHVESSKLDNYNEIVTKLEAFGLTRQPSNLDNIDDKGNIIQDNGYFSMFFKGSLGSHTSLPGQYGRPPENHSVMAYVRVEGHLEHGEIQVQYVCSCWSTDNFTAFSSDSVEKQEHEIRTPNFKDVTDHLKVVKDKCGKTENLHKVTIDKLKGSGIQTHVHSLGINEFTIECQIKGSGELFWVKCFKHDEPDSKIFDSHKYPYSYSRTRPSDDGWYFRIPDPEDNRPSRSVHRPSIYNLRPLDEIVPVVKKIIKEKEELIEKERADSDEMSSKARSIIDRMFSAFGGSRGDDDKRYVTSKIRGAVEHNDLDWGDEESDYLESLFKEKGAGKLASERPMARKYASLLNKYMARIANDRLNQLKVLKDGGDVEAGKEYDRLADRLGEKVDLDRLFDQSKKEVDGVLEHLEKMRGVEDNNIRDMVMKKKMKALLITSGVKPLSGLSY